MFPQLVFRLSGLNPAAHYNVFVDMVIADSNTWKFQCGKWVVTGKSDGVPKGKTVCQSPMNHFFYGRGGHQSNNVKHKKLANHNGRRIISIN